MNSRAEYSSNATVYDALSLVNRDDLIYHRSSTGTEEMLADITSRICSRKSFCILAESQELYNGLLP